MASKCIHLGGGARRGAQGKGKVMAFLARLVSRLRIQPKPSGPISVLDQTPEKDVEYSAYALELVARTQLLVEQAKELPGLKKLLRLQEISPQLNKCYGKRNDTTPSPLHASVELSQAVSFLIDACGFDALEQLLIVLESSVNELRIAVERWAEGWERARRQLQRRRELGHFEGLDFDPMVAITDSQLELLALCERVRSLVSIFCFQKSELWRRHCPTAEAELDIVIRLLHGLPASDAENCTLEDFFTVPYDVCIKEGFLKADLALDGVHFTVRSGHERMAKPSKRHPALMPRKLV